MPLFDLTTMASQFQSTVARRVAQHYRIEMTAAGVNGRLHPMTAIAISAQRLNY